MATAANTARPVGLAEPLSLGRRILALIPGLLLLTAVGYAGKFIEQSIALYTKSHHITFPNIEYVLWAIVIGLLITNTLGVPRVFQAGVATYEFWLKAGIVLLGSRFLLGDIWRLGGISLLLVAVALTLSLTFMHVLGRSFKLKPKLTSLLAVGSSICGVSAIIAAKPAIDADDEDAFRAERQRQLPERRRAAGQGHARHAADHGAEPHERAGAARYQRRRYLREHDVDAVDVADPAMSDAQRSRVAFIAAAGSAFITMTAQTMLATPIA